MFRNETTFTRVALVFGMLLGTVAAAASSAQETSLIDTQLSAGLDFRDSQFKICFGQTTCEVNGYRILGFHRHGDVEPWHGAPLYWDPIDGFGVLGSGQDDEIDINERLIIEFPFQRKLRAVWLTDLFVNETRYVPTEETLAEEAEPLRQGESAGIEIRLGKTTQLSLIVNGDLNLPNRSFNETINAELFDTGDDLRQRLVIRDGKISILIASQRDGDKKTVISTISIDQLDADKRKLFQNGDDDIYDLSELLSGELDIELFPDGTRNAERIAAVLDDPSTVSALGNAARVGRSISNVPNGEVSGKLAPPAAATSIMLFAPVGTSNDFSIAGIVFE